MLTYSNQCHIKINLIVRRASPPKFIDTRKIQWYKKYNKNEGHKGLQSNKKSQPHHEKEKLNLA